MNGEGGLSEFEQQIWSLKYDVFAGYELGSPRPGLFSPNIPLEEIYATISAGILAATGSGAFGVGVPPAAEPAGSPESPRPTAVVSVIDPESETSTTVFETAEPLPDVSYELPHAPTDWDAVYDEFVILNPEIFEPEVVISAPPVISPEVVLNVPTERSEKENSVAIDWGDIASTAIGSAFQGFFGDSAPGYGGNLTPTMYGQPQTIPAKVTVDTRTGKVVPCRRRRRRKLLTESDFNVLLRISTLPNKENVRIALGKAIGRG